jgi:hypothetical protein
MIRQNVVQQNQPLFGWGNHPGQYEVQWDANDEDLGFLFRMLAAEPGK